MARTKLTRRELTGKVIDGHTHAGISLKAYACIEFPYGQTIEGLYYQQRVCNIDATVVFALGADLYMDTHALMDGIMQPAAKPLSVAPYATENRMLFEEVYRFCPELSDRFLPFVRIDPAQAVDAQLTELRALADEYPIYGIKLAGVSTQTDQTRLVDTGQPLLEFAREHDLPLLFHVTVDPREQYSSAAKTLGIAEQIPDLRICLAHCAGFDATLLDRADQLPNVWVDTSALKIQVQLVYEESPLMASKQARINADYSDHTRVMQALADKYPHTIIWASDSPAYSYICNRVQGEGVVEEFRLKATMEDEKAALDVLEQAAQLRHSNTNTLDFLFGPGS